ncbi:MAG: (Fe-S)-binding protein [Candidatus Jordarchaeaceae archaeon]
MVYTSTVRLYDYISWIARCNKCSACTEYVPDGSYEGLCPMAERNIKESFRPSGLMELARQLAIKEHETGETNIAELAKLVGFNTKSLSERFFSCTECGVCDISCYTYSGKHPLKIFKAVRRKLVQAGLAPSKFDEVRKNIINYYSPFITDRSRAVKMGKFFRIPEVAEIPKRGKILYFIGCTTAHSRPQIAQSVIKILNMANISFGVMHEEMCCGYPLIHTGQEDAAINLVKSNVQKIKETEARTVLTSCAGCFQVLSQDYPELVDNIPFEVAHTTRFFANLINNKKIRSNPIDTTVTYHDPCNIGRKATDPMYEEPRTILSSIPKLNLVEMSRRKQSSFCCGSGGGVVWAYPFKMTDWVSKNRVSEAIKVLGQGEEKYLVSACPACELSLGSVGKLNVKDISEILASSINVK